MYLCWLLGAQVVVLGHCHVQRFSLAVEPLVHCLLDAVCRCCLFVLTIIANKWEREGTACPLSLSFLQRGSLLAPGDPNAGHRRRVSFVCVLKGSKHSDTTRYDCCLRVGCLLRHTISNRPIDWPALPLQGCQEMNSVSERRNISSNNNSSNLLNSPNIDCL